LISFSSVDGTGAEDKRRADRDARQGLRRSWSLIARYEEMILELRCLVQAFRNGTR